jgi:transcriptional regulator with XRE-family HTH domain
MPGRLSGAGEESSPLRRARLARNWTLEDVVEEIDMRTPGGHSGVIPSMVSGWELGRHATSIGHRKTLCEIYRQSPEALFAYQDRSLTMSSVPWLVAGFPDLQGAMLATVTGARQCLVVLGSRSRHSAPGYRSSCGATARYKPSWPSVTAWHGYCPAPERSSLCSAHPNIGSASARYAFGAAWSTRQHALSKSAMTGH